MVHDATHSEKNGEEQDMQGQIIDDKIDAEEVEHDQYLVFKVKSQEFCIQAMQVPNSFPYIDGVANLRGRLSTVINFRKKIGLEEKQHDEETRIIVIEDKGYPIGMTVDSVEEVIKIPGDLVHKLPGTTSNVIEDEPITGIGMVNKRMIIMLDIKKILDRNTVFNLEEMKQVLISSQAGEVDSTASITSPSLVVGDKAEKEESRHGKDHDSG
jgi:purine-binding chemotaxis protein CheW